MDKDIIYRQAAIDELTENKEMINAALDSLTLDYNTRRNQEQRRGQINEDIETIKALPSAEPKTRDWIPVSERLPETTGKYLVTVRNGNVYASEFSTISGKFRVAAVAWMPLPEAWKGWEGDQ